MKIIEHSLPSNHNIFLFSCKHEGSVLSTNTGWNKMVSMILSPYDGCRNNYASEGGDMVEAITIDDKRFDSDKLKEPLPMEQINVAVEKRQAIKHLYLDMLDGNHERKLWSFGNIAREIANRLEVPYGTYTDKLIIQDKSGNLMYKIFHTHGRKSITSTADDPIRKESNEQLILKRHLKEKAGDCAVMVKAHVHKVITCPPKRKLYLTDNNGKIRQNYTEWGQNETYIHPDSRWYGCSGSFLRLYGDGISGYAEIAEYDPVELGFLILKVRDKKIVELEPYKLNI